MSGNQTEISIVSNALILIGAEPITSYEDSGDPGIVGKSLFHGAYHELLQSYDWDFARKVVSLSRLAGETLSGYSAKYQLPSDMLRMIDADSASYDILGSELHTNASTVQIEYVADVNVESAPIYFTNALEYTLAAKLAVPLTGDLNKSDYYSKIAISAQRKARHNDARQTPNLAIQSKPFLEARKR